MKGGYRVKMESFEGPLSLLLDLIEKEKMDITKLSLVRVADDFLVYFQSRRDVDLAQLSDFLLVSSQLILLKSKALLPLFEFTQEEATEIENLEYRLMEYQRYKTATEKLKKLFLSNQKCFSRQEDNLISHRLFVPVKTDGQMLKSLFSRLLQELPQPEKMEEAFLQEIVSLEEKIVQLTVSLEKRMRMAFHETVKHSQNKIEVIVTFLAMLEMVKQKIIFVQQEKLFGDIFLEKQKTNCKNN